MSTKHKSPRSVQIDDELQLEDFGQPTTPHSPSITHGSDLSELRELLEKNIKWSQVIFEQNKRMKKRLTMMSVAGYIRLIIILVPIVLGLIYLPPILREVWT